ncbi:hypothetical protein A3J36_03620 [Candidatus Uhrbacteria bacterium RIFCSPLOWO2_02_FULL_54_37]|uniref:Transcriptional regulator n=2 Tax=Candidatus Uhriibacteriota TaxID=1752732 RepID=A0A1F7VJC9_9BACT|nr:MAG: hypothetical protein A3B36_01100 [Candidatus Uhrbacteria bacterium RIFCSPLOWO2_01_FULL_55_36]OGL90576.1 MAG: hypothetical protein A3J36_03620 [Candidatus Uhrbacteria bacterium RIFCSPLOWO2_02_FULL_54_37]
MDHSLHKKHTRRLKIIEGQVRGLQRMVEEGAYCVDLITQSSAVKEALSSFEDAVLENHLNTHVVEQMKSGEHKRATNEILKVYRLSKKK